MKGLERIYQAACTASKVDIKSKKRDRDTYVYGRFAYYIVAKRTTGFKDHIVANHIGFDRAMVIHATNIYDELLKSKRFLNILTETYRLIGVKFKQPENKNDGYDLQPISADNDKLRIEISKLKDKSYQGVLREFKDLLESLSIEGVTEAKKRLEPFVKMYNSRKTYDNTTREERG